MTATQAVGSAVPRRWKELEIEIQIELQFVNLTKSGRHTALDSLQTLVLLHSTIFMGTVTQV